MPVVKRHRIGDEIPAVIHPDPDPTAIALCQELAERTDVLCVILYGSRSRGGWDEQSDLDLIIVRENAEDDDEAKKKAYLALDSLKERHYPGYSDHTSPHFGVKQRQISVTLDDYLAHQRTLNDVMARAAREGLIFTREPGAEQRYHHDGNTSNEWELVTLERLKRAASASAQLDMLQEIHDPRPVNRINVNTRTGTNAHELLWHAATALLSILKVLHPVSSLVDIAQALKENDPDWSREFASDLDCIDHYAGCGCEVVVTRPITDVPAMWKDLRTDRNALWERIRQVSGYDLDKEWPPIPHEELVEIVRKWREKTEADRQRRADPSE